MLSCAHDASMLVLAVGLLGLMLLLEGLVLATPGCLI
jgi:hypothetical protein